MALCTWAGVPGTFFTVVVVTWGNTERPKVEPPSSESSISMRMVGEYAR